MGEMVMVVTAVDEATEDWVDVVDTFAVKVTVPLTELDDVGELEVVLVADDVDEGGAENVRDGEADDDVVGVPVFEIVEVTDAQPVDVLVEVKLFVALAVDVRESVLIAVDVAE